MNHWTIVKESFAISKTPCTMTFFFVSLLMFFYAFSDSNWVGNVNDRTLTSMYIVFLVQIH